MARLWANQSPPLPVRFLGWESDTYTLGRCGWEVAMHEDYGLRMGVDAITVVLRHPKAGLVAHGSIQLPFGQSRELLFGHFHPGQLPAIELQAIGSEVNMMIRAPMALYNGLTLRETVPQSYALVDERIKLGKLPVFAPKGGNPADDLIVDPAQVQELLDKILAIQSPQMRDIRQREARRERTAEPQRQVHAQIVTLQAA